MLLKLVSWMSRNCFCYPDTLKTTLHLAICIEYCSKQLYPLVQHAQKLHPCLVWICYKHHQVGVMKLHICCECYLKRYTYNMSIGASNSHFVSRGTNILLMWKRHYVRYQYISTTFKAPHLIPHHYCKKCLVLQPTLFVFALGCILKMCLAWKGIILINFSMISNGFDVL